ncbi:urocanate hydratase [Salmonella enterica subsp. diarizonae]|uniref:Urocanate hydratase n=1 Tax=Salmonella diarizonae TaxID=59204 RepID=A0A379U4K2_SALDZ|nr:urocanate hydratase [Salmonella enterica subsp. diarizonae]
MSRPPRWMTLWPALRTTPARGKPCPWPCARTRRISCRSWLIVACAGPGDRSDQRPRSATWLFAFRLALGGVSGKRAIRSPGDDAGGETFKWRRTFGRCWHSVKWACRPLTMATIFARWRKRWGWKTPLIFRDLCQPIFVRFLSRNRAVSLGGVVRRSAGYL